MPSVVEPSKAFARPEFLSLRSPLLAFDDLLRWADPGWQIAADDPRFEQAFKESRELLRRRLRQALSRPEIREGLFLVSGDFFKGLNGSVREPENEQGIGAALAEQLVRLATVVEFSGMQMAPLTGEIARATRLHLGALSSRHSQVDIDYLTAAAEAAAHLPSVRRGQRFFNNSTLYRVHAKARCLTSHGDGAARQYRSVTIELTPHLETIIKVAESGATLDERYHRVAVAGEERLGELLDPIVGPFQACQHLRPAQDLRGNFFGQGRIGRAPEDPNAKQRPVRAGHRKELGNFRIAWRLSAERLPVDVPDPFAGAVERASDVLRLGE